MKKQCIQLLSILCMLGFLVGCKEKLTYDYLLRHPLVTKEEATKCLDAKYQTQENTNQCKLVMTAASKLMVVISEQQEDPETFGMKIMDLEKQYAQAKSALQAAKLQVEKSTANEKNTAQMSLQQAEKTYNEIDNELQMLLAVARLNSPE